MNARRVDFWFDPLCPWTWLSAEWLLDVAQRRPLDIHWRVLSLALLNEGRELPDEYVALMARAIGPVRVLTAARVTSGEDVVLPLYLELAERYHRQSRADDAIIMAESLAAAGLPAELAEAAASSEYDEALRADHDAGMALVGDDVGSPIISLPRSDGLPGSEETSVAYFGPVVNPVPRGADADRLWDGLVLMTAVPGFHELKRTRDGAPIID